MQHYFDTTNIKTSTHSETPSTKTATQKNKTRFIKKILSSYQGLDLRNA